MCQEHKHMESYKTNQCSLTWHKAKAHLNARGTAGRCQTNLWLTSKSFTGASLTFFFRLTFEIIWPPYFPHSSLHLSFLVETMKEKMPSLWAGTRSSSDSTGVSPGRGLETWATGKYSGGLSNLSMEHIKDSFSPNPSSHCWVCA